MVVVIGDRVMGEKGLEGVVMGEYAIFRERREATDLGFNEGEITNLPLLSYLCLYFCVHLSFLIEDLGHAITQKIIKPWGIKQR